MIIKGYEPKPEPKATHIDLWYNPHLRLWEATPQDDDGNFVGETVYCYGKKLAMITKRQMEEELK